MHVVNDVEKNEEDLPRNTLAEDHQNQGIDEEARQRHPATVPAHAGGEKRRVKNAHYVAETGTQSPLSSEGGFGAFAPSEHAPTTLHNGTKGGGGGGFWSTADCCQQPGRVPHPGSPSLKRSRQPSSGSDSDTQGRPSLPAPSRQPYCRFSLPSETPTLQTSSNAYAMHEGIQGAGLGPPMTKSPPPPYDLALEDDHCVQEAEVATSFPNHFNACARDDNVMREAEAPELFPKRFSEPMVDPEDRYRLQETDAPAPAALLPKPFTRNTLVVDEEDDGFGDVGVSWPRPLSDIANSYDDRNPGGFAPDGFGNARTSERFLTSEFSPSFGLSSSLSIAEDLTPVSVNREASGGSLEKVSADVRREAAEPENNEFSSPCSVVGSAALKLTMPGNNEYNTSHLPERPKRKHIRGITGLQNLGNTCFMNSALQCLSNTARLTQFFLDGTYKTQINRTNPLGMKGEVAETYGCLVERLWAPDGQDYVVPRDFKYTIARFAPFFTGYQQHDSQELLNFLLDGLHEDLNRIEKKPYIELKDSDGRPDEAVANEVWDAHKARNDSVITDIFSGQFKSTLVCPECKRVSVTFDPFSTVSLPLPVAKKKQLDVFVVRADPSKRLIKIQLSLPKDASHKTMKEQISRFLNLDTQKLVSTEVFRNKFFKFFTDEDCVSEIQSNDLIYVYELEHPISTAQRAFSDSEAGDDGFVTVGVMNVESTTSSFSANAFGYPLLVQMTRDEVMDPDEIYRCLVEQCQRLTTLPLRRALRGAKRRSADMADMTDGQPAGGVLIPDLFTSRLMVEWFGRFSRSGEFNFNSNSIGGLSGINPSSLKPIDYRAKTDSGWDQPAPKPVNDPWGAATPPASPPSPPPPPGEFWHTTNGIDIVATEHPADMVDEITELPRIPLLVTGDAVVCEWPYSYIQYAFSQQAEEDQFVMPSWRSEQAAPEDDSDGNTSRAREDTAEDVENSVAHLLGPEKGRSLNSVYQTVETPEFRRDRDEEDRRRLRGVSLLDCFDEFMRTERLSEGNLWYCRDCKEHREASKSMGFWKLPDVLVVQLKRFAQSRTLRDKIDIMVDFDVEGLDLTSRVEGMRQDEENGMIYDLYAISNHYGGLGGGHYTAYAQNPENCKWYHFDDSRVEPVSPSEIKTPAAYLLFYKRRGSPPALPVIFPVSLHEESDHHDEALTSRNRPGLIPSKPSFSGRARSQSLRINLSTKRDAPLMDGAAGSLTHDPEKENATASTHGAFPGVGYVLGGGQVAETVSPDATSPPGSPRTAPSPPSPDRNNEEVMTTSSTSPSRASTPHIEKLMLAQATSPTMAEQLSAVSAEGGGAAGAEDDMPVEKR